MLMVNHVSSLTVTIILMEKVYHCLIPTSQWSPLRILRVVPDHCIALGAGAGTKKAKELLPGHGRHILLLLLLFWKCMLLRVFHTYDHVYIYICLYITWSTYNTHIISYIYACVCVFPALSPFHPSLGLPMSELPGDLVTVDGHPAALIQVETKSMSCPAPWWNS